MYLKRCDYILALCAQYFEIQRQFQLLYVYLLIQTYIVFIVLTCTRFNSLHAGNFLCFCCSLLTFSKFKITIGVIQIRTSLDPDQARRFVGPDLVPSCFQRLSYTCSYTMACSPVRGDILRALASGLSYIQVDKHGMTILYHLH